MFVYNLTLSLALMGGRYLEDRAIKGLLGHGTAVQHTVELQTNISKKRKTEDSQSHNASIYGYGWLVSINS